MGLCPLQRQAASCCLRARVSRCDDGQVAMQFYDVVLGGNGKSPLPLALL